MTEIFKFIAASKKVMSTVVVILLALGGLCRLILDLPEAILKIAHLGPTWLCNPDFWWMGGIAFLVVVALIIIWRKPDEIDSQSEFNRVFANQSFHVLRLAGFLSDIWQFKEKLAATKPSKRNTSYVMNVLEVVYPVRISELLGDEICRKYVSTMATAKKKSKHLYIILQTALPVVENALIDEIDRLYLEPSELTNGSGNTKSQ